MLETYYARTAKLCALPCRMEESSLEIDVGICTLQLEVNEPRAVLPRVLPHKTASNLQGSAARSLFDNTSSWFKGNADNTRDGSQNTSTFRQCWSWSL